MTLTIVIAPQIEVIRHISKYLVQIMLGFFVLGILFLIFDKRKLLLTSFGLSAMLCVFLKNQSNTELLSPTPSSSTILSIMHINLGNADDAFDLIGSLNKEDADIISFQELTPDWSEAIQKVMLSTHPYFVEEVRIDPYGKSVYSKYPIRKVDTIRAEGAIDLNVDVQVDGNVFHLFSTYIIPALNKNTLGQAKNQLNEISKFISKNNQKCVVFGEFNMVYWDEEIIRFRNMCDLKNSRKDVMPTGLKVPYDHMFYSNDLVCLGYEDVYSSASVKVGCIGRYQLAETFDITKKNRVN